MHNKQTLGSEKKGSLYLFLYSTSQGHTLYTAVPQPARTCFHKFLLDRDADWLTHWDSKILSHTEVEESFLKYRCNAECISIPRC